MIILCDIDNTINNLTKVLLDELNERNSTTYQYSEITDYDWLNHTFEDPFEPTEHKEFWDKVSVDTNAVRFLESCVQDEIKVYLVTASHFNDTLGYKINKTLSFFNPEFITYTNVIIASDKHMIIGDILIDDHIDNLNNFDGDKVCFKQPWNHTWVGKKLSHWPEIKLLT